MFSSLVCLPSSSSDPVVTELAAKVAGRLVSSGGSLAAESVENEVNRALEWLSGDRNEGKRHAAVLVLRELAVNAPTFFFQKVQPFLDHIFNAIRDPKVSHGLVACLLSVSIGGYLHCAKILVILQVARLLLLDVFFHKDLSFPSSSG